MLRKFAALLTSVMVSIAMLAVFAAPVFAQTIQGPACQVGDTSKVLIHENISGDTSDGDDAHWRCSGTADLQQISHTLPGNCKDAVIPGSPNWGNCASSISIWLPDNQKVCLYRGTNFTLPLNGSNAFYNGPQFGARKNLTADAFNNDALKSIAFVPKLNACPS